MHVLTEFVGRTKFESFELMRLDLLTQDPLPARGHWPMPSSDQFPFPCPHLPSRAATAAAPAVTYPRRWPTFKGAACGGVPPCGRPDVEMRGCRLPGQYGINGALLAGSC